ncbi:MAG: M23 family metallopeptidase [Anaerolineales bacterium]
MKLTQRTVLVLTFWLVLGCTVRPNNPNLQPTSTPSPTLPFIASSPTIPTPQNIRPTTVYTPIGTSSAAPVPQNNYLEPPLSKETTNLTVNWRPPLYPTPWEPTAFDHFLFSRPILANTPSWALADYRYGGVFWRNVVHTGIDIPLPVGNKVYAAGSGRVSWSGFGLMSGSYNPDDPYGLAIVIRHDFGYQGQTLYTVYGHLSQSYVTVGQHVDVGEVIGLSGASGKVTGPHLHFEVRVGDNSFGRSRNPELWIVPPQGWGILAGRLIDSKDNFLQRKKVLIRSLENSQRYYVYSYGSGPVNPDPYYRENLAIGDLPAGWYRLLIPDLTSQHLDIQIYPGKVSFFSFILGEGFNNQTPNPLYNDFKTPEVPTTITP